MNSWPPTEEPGDLPMPPVEDPPLPEPLEPYPNDIPEPEPSGDTPE